MKNRIFEFLNFKYDGYIEEIEFDGVFCELKNNKAIVGGNTKIRLARAYFLFAKNFANGIEHFTVKQKPHFDTLGAMIDCSRGGVMRVEAVKKYIDSMACLGFNMLMLYTEDTYEIKEYPSFGYLRGRYTKEELCEIDDYAFAIGIEVIPCIQTLSHLQKFLRFPSTSGMRETQNTLQIDNPNAYNFIECAIKAVSECFRSKKIHIGMDEAHDMGVGKSTDERCDMFLRHLEKVCDICKKYGFHPMMWSDMFFKFSDKFVYDYDFNVDISQDVIEKVPDVGLVFWDYYHKNADFYSVNLEKHEKFGKELYFAGGVWTFEGFIPNVGYTIDTMTPALSECLKHDTRHVFATMWENFGNETNMFFSLWALPIFSEYCYNGDNAKPDDIYSCAETLTGISSEVIKAADAFHMGLDGAQAIGKRFFYCDPLYNLIMFDYDPVEVEKSYSDSLKVLKAAKQSETVRYCTLVIEISMKKCSLIRQLRAKYIDNDTNYLKNVCENIIPELKNMYSELLKIHKRQWLATYKPAGFEVLNIRYGGILSRLDYANDAILDYLSGRNTRIEELDEEIINETKGSWRQSEDTMTI